MPSLFLIPSLTRTSVTRTWPVSFVKEFRDRNTLLAWIPAFAGMTVGGD